MADRTSPLPDFPRTRQGVWNLDQPQRFQESDPMPVNVGQDERMLSSLGGSVLAVTGLVEGGCAGLCMIFTGTALLVRGLTGHCPVNAMVNRDTSEVPSQGSKPKMALSR